MKKILCIINNMNAGGAETFLMKIYRALDREKYQMDFCINIYEKNYYEDEINRLGGKIYRIPAKSSDMIKHCYELYSLIKNNKYKNILLISSRATAYLDVLIAKKAGAQHCCIRSSNSDINMSLKEYTVHNILRMLFNKYADILFAPSDLAAKNMFGKLYDEDKRFFFLKNGLDINLFRFSKEKRHKIRKEFCLSHDDVVIGHIGRFYEQKNHEFLIDIFSNIAKKNDGAKLLLVGNGQLEEKIKDKIHILNLQDKVIFTGVRSDIADLLSAMDVFVFPSLFEGMPNVVIEAQTSGLPCVIADTITKQARITDLVTFMPLQASAEAWADVALKQHGGKREWYADAVQEQGYGISEVAERFVSLAFK